MSRNKQRTFNGVVAGVLHELWKHKEDGIAKSLKTPLFIPAINELGQAIGKSRLFRLRIAQRRQFRKGFEGHFSLSPFTYASHIEKHQLHFRSLRFSFNHSSAD